MNQQDIRARIISAIDGKRSMTDVVLKLSSERPRENAEIKRQIWYMLDEGRLRLGKNRVLFVRDRSA